MGRNLGTKDKLELRELLGSSSPQSKVQLNASSDTF